jgi:hypothetical protein
MSLLAIAVAGLLKEFSECMKSRSSDTLGAR